MFFKKTTEAAAFVVLSVRAYIDFHSFSLLLYPNSNFNPNLNSFLAIPFLSGSGIFRKKQSFVHVFHTSHYRVFFNPLFLGEKFNGVGYSAIRA